jgi:phthiocerol/phenolphthiocerol synthesis type-I polyketide synthase D
LSINWGPWSETGAAAGAELAARLSFRGIRGLTCDEGVRLLESALGRPEAQLLAIEINWPRWSAGLPHRQAGSLWSELSRVVPENGSNGRPAMNVAARTAPADYLRQAVANLLEIPADRLDSHRRLVEFGFDSLMSISLRNRVESELGMRIPIVHFFHSQTLDELSSMIAQQLRR